MAATFHDPSEGCVGDVTSLGPRAPRADRGWRGTLLRAGTHSQTTARSPTVRAWPLRAAVRVRPRRPRADARSSRIVVLGAAADQPVTKLARRRQCSACSRSCSVYSWPIGDPTNWVGPLLVLIAPLAIVLSTRRPDRDPVVRPGSGLRPLWNLSVQLSPGGWMWLFVPPALLVLVFPDGRPPGPSWRWVGYGSGDRAGALPGPGGCGPEPLRRRRTPTSRI